MHSAAQAYTTTAKTVANPRDLEAQLLLRAAARLQGVLDGRTSEPSQIDQALRFNRKLWSVLATSATAAENPLPRAIKQNVGNIAVFVLRVTTELEMKFAVERLRSLININREIAAGLQQAAPAAA